MADITTISDNTKLQNFSRHVFEQAVAQRDQTLHELENAKAELYSQAEVKCYEDAYNKIQKNKLRIMRESNEQLSRAHLESKKSLTMHRTEIMEEVFAEVYGRLQAFIQSDQYYPWLLNCANNAISAFGDSGAELYINASDAAHQASLQKDCGHTVKVLDKKDDIIGGVRAVDNAAHKAFSDTLAQRMEQQKGEFLKISKLNI